MRPKAAASVLAGALLLVWPAFANGYPLLFSDSIAFLYQTLGPMMIWDKPWIYGPASFLLHGHRSFWPLVIGQGLLVSHLLWLVLRVFGGGAALGRHLLLCLLVAALTAAPFTVALVMPDVFTPVLLLAAPLLGIGRPALSRGEAIWLGLVLAVGAAAHLSHLPILAALAALSLLAGWRAAGRVALPLAGAVGLLLATNLAGHGQASLSPYGSTFLLARLVANGSAIRTVEASCPGAGWTLCAWKGRLDAYGPEACRLQSCPPDRLPSDIFLWHPDSPVNRAPDGTEHELGGVSMAPEARAVIAATLAREPVSVALDAARDTFAQLLRNGLGDTLEHRHVGDFMLGHVRRLGEGEAARFEASPQWRDTLPALVAPLLWVQAPTLLLGAAALLLLGWQARRDRAAFAFALGIVVGVLANAFATGALSGPHDRYGARVAWVVVVGGFVLAVRRWERA